MAGNTSKAAAKKSAPPKKTGAPAKKSSTPAKKPKPKEALLPSVTNTAPTAIEVHDELTIYWDGLSPLSLNAIRASCAAGHTLEEIGLDEEKAQGCVNKYNSLILRAPGKGPLVTFTEAGKWLSSKMLVIIQTVTERAQP